MVNKKRQKDGIIQYLLTQCQDVAERQAVIDSISINLKELNIVINREDLASPIPRVPLVEPLQNAPRFAPPPPLAQPRANENPRMGRAPPPPPDPRIPPQRPAERPPRREDDKCVFL